MLKVVPGEQDRPQHLAGLEQVVQVGAAEAAAGRAGAIRIERPVRFGMAGVADVQLAAGHEGLARASGAGRQHAIEHIDAPGDGADDVRRPPDAHQIARFIVRQGRRCDVQRLEHRLLAFADRQPADGIALETDAGQRQRRFGAQIRKHTALNDAELAVAGTSPEGRAAALGPAHGQAHRVGRGGFFHWPGGAFVQSHRDRRIQIVLDRRRTLGCQPVLAAVDMGAEGDARLRHRAQAAERHDLEAATVGQDRTGPAHEAVQAAQRLDPRCARPEHQVVGVAQHDFRAGVRDMVRQHTLDRAGCADRHEGRRLRRAVGRVQPSTPGRAVDAQKLEPELSHGPVSPRSRPGLTPV